MYILYLLIIAIDQILKKIFVSIYDFSASKVILVKNSGIAFGLFPRNTMIIIGLNFVLLFCLFKFRKHFFQNNLLHKLSLTFILAGGSSNLIDRIFLGYVIDFIKVPFIPVFNIADMAINLGLVFLVLGWINRAKK
ncbi:MAG: hypothetical protein A2Y40_10435 [Candidatus Margulisbacteria bacterium GWF2_35_9]|nr:MAG: hypothetical protein A2Y40_10435 [Candidatus Margulisbacteria bacterium GWF2_35_9]